MRDENQDLRECLKLLQREIFDIVNLKQDIYTKRFKAEFGGQSKDVASGSQAEIQENIAHQIETIREDLFNLPFEDSGKELIHRFKVNF